MHHRLRVPFPVEAIDSGSSVVECNIPLDVGRVELVSTLGKHRRKTVKVGLPPSASYPR